MATAAKSPNLKSLLSAMLASGKDNQAIVDELNGALKGEVEIVRQGEKILIPENMTYDEAITWITREKLNDEAEVAVNHQIHALPTDGAVALAAVLREQFGFVSLVSTPSFFGKKPPVMVSIPIGPGIDDVIQAPWGRMELPGIDGYLQTNATITDGRPTFVLTGVVKRANEKAVLEIAAAIRKRLATHSIYRGKAIKVEFNVADNYEDSPFDEKFVPKFLKLGETKVILNEDARQRLDIELYNPIKYSEQCRKRNIPLKRGVLLEGPYGTGKTLTAYDLAACCVKHGWTFIYLDNAAALQQAINFAQVYQPCVIFAEDVDKVIEQHKDPDLTAIRNALDSVETKNTEISVVLTTNHIEQLPAGFLRCGRIDSIVPIERPDARSTTLLAKHYGGPGLAGSDEEIMRALTPIVGQSAALIRECVDRAKLSAISSDTNEGPLVITPNDLAVTAETLAKHTKVLDRQPANNEVHPAVAMYAAMVKAITTHMTAETDKVLDNM